MYVTLTDFARCWSRNSITARLPLSRLSRFIALLLMHRGVAHQEGAMAVFRHTAKQVSEEESWLGGMLARKPKMLVAVALANKIARVAWALMARGGVYESPATV
jgi:hypothetical protein